MTSLEPKFYVNAEGIFQGSFSGVEVNGVETFPFTVDADWIQVPTAPASVAEVWDFDNEKWITADD